MKKDIENREALRKHENKQKVFHNMKVNYDKAI